MSAGPYPASSHHLRAGRIQADVCSPKDGRGARKVLEVGRFVTVAQARAWADVEHPGADLVLLTRFSAHDGWTAHAAGRRQAGEWMNLTHGAGR